MLFMMRAFVALVPGLGAYDGAWLQPFLLTHPTALRVQMATEPRMNLGKGRAAPGFRRLWRPLHGHELMI